MASAKVMNRPLIDPSEILRPEPIHAGKPIAQFRDYTIDDTDPIKERVRKLYYDMHKYQTVDFVKKQHAKWLKFDKFRAPIMDTLERLSGMLDQSDPDVDVPNIVHAFQTAERIREDHPDCDWLQLTGLLHDMGKIMAFYDEPQWAVTGDTFPVGCAWADSIVYRNTTFHDNPDTHNPKYNTKYGMYTPNCGLDNVLMAWGHDEYVYRLLKHNGSKLPEMGHKIIRFHSFYPWHSSGDYMHLCNEEDMETLKWVLEFNKYDLYSKSDEMPDIEKLKPYYQSLIDKYVPGVLSW
ncbi:inositol oxygenase-like isoform X2 [Schistocerca nitens]|uniref:inositol oxygenase-like isoform X2 n=1 Tax=Schistocerca nitens TaxID=7011 RepID=UPI00211960A0|nr:inositol oxygenase-like isoform X2 [Schistocerca nitens]